MDATSAMTVHATPPTARSVGFALFDNWISPRVGGVPPSPRAFAASATLGRVLYVFGGWGATLRPGAGWVDGAEGDFARLPDMYALNTDAMTRWHPTRTAPDLAWHQARHT